MSSTLFGSKNDNLLATASDSNTLSESTEEIVMEVRKTLQTVKNTVNNLVAARNNSTFFVGNGANTAGAPIENLQQCEQALEKGIKKTADLEQRLTQNSRLTT